jgi:hypothetical protein
MRPRSAAILACRIIALFFGIETVIATISFLAFAPEGFEGSGSFWAITGTTAAISFFLWVGAETFSTAMAHGAADEAPSPPRSLVNSHAVAFSVVGIVLITQAIPALISAAAYGGGGAGFGPLSFTADFGGQNAAIVAGVVRLVMGAFLVGGSGDLAARLARRYPEPEPPASS